MQTVTFNTDLGAMAIAYQGQKVLALAFGHSTESSALRAVKRRVKDSPLQEPDNTDQELELVDDLIDRLQTFAEGEPVDFSEIQIDDSYGTSFQRRVLKACRAIPWGETRTYGELAKIAGRPGAARAVGTVMAGNRVPLIVPCHRVVPASGGFGGFSAPQGVKMKRRLLTQEQQPALA